MGKQKYTKEQIETALELRKHGYIKKDITEKTTIPAGYLNLLFKKNNIKLDKDSVKKAISRRWANHNPFNDKNELKCNSCLEYKGIDCFSKDKSSKSGFSLKCKSCVSNLYTSNSETIKSKVKEYRNKNKNSIRIRDKIYREKNKEAISARKKQRMADNYEDFLVKSRERGRKFSKNNRPSRNASASLYRSKKVNATPKWLTREQKKQILDFYKNCKKGFQVDHIVPIRSEIVCGLHVPWNLQLIPEILNNKKGCYFFDPNIVDICFQYKRKLATKEEDIKSGMPFGSSVSDFSFSEEKLSDEHLNFIRRYEWLGTIGYNYNLRIFVARHISSNYIGGLIVIGEPVTRSLGVDKQHEALIQRGATTSWAPKNLGSSLLMYSCKTVAKTSEKRVFVGYSDPEAGEIGTIYQACNFSYLGNRFGATTLYRLPNGKKVSNKYFTKTSTLKRYAKKLDIDWQKDWQKENGYKDMSKIPKDVLKSLREEGYRERASCVVENPLKKGKYALLVSVNRREKHFLLKKYKNFLSTLPYPKRVYSTDIT